MTTATPVDDGLFTWPDAPHLVGATCRHCSTTTFPAQASCPRCTRGEMTRVALAATGSLWSFTIQGFEPKTPYNGEGPFAPYGVGYVELAAEGGAPVLVEGRLTESDPSLLHIGDEVEVVFVPYRHDDSGGEVVTFAFRPTGRSAPQPAASSDKAGRPDQAGTPDVGGGR